MTRTTCLVHLLTIRGRARFIPNSILVRGRSSTAMTVARSVPASKKPNVRLS